MKFRDLVGKLAARAAVEQAQAAIRALHGKSASRWVADEAGVSPRTARRWLSATPPAGRVAAIIALAPTYQAAAQVLRASDGTVSAGSVEVAYDEEYEGGRFIGDVNIDVGPIADALENGSIEFAEAAFSAAVLEEYGPGLGETLTIDNYGDDLDVH